MALVKGVKTKEIREQKSRNKFLFLWPEKTGCDYFFRHSFDSATFKRLFDFLDFMDFLQDFDYIRPR